MMQQTEKYKLNLIETTDTFSPAPLNENAQKIEAALESGLAAVSSACAAEAQTRASADAAEAQTRASADAAESSARAAADAALDSRVTVLEATRLVFGSYKGTVSASHPTQTIALGFTPRAVFVIDQYRKSEYMTIRIADNTLATTSSWLKIVENGFRVEEGLNSSTYTYIYIAIT